MEELIDKQLLQEVAPIYRELGLTVEQAINVFLAKSIKAQGFPFAVTLNDPAVNENETVPKISNAEIISALLQLIDKSLPELEIQNLCNLDYCKTTFGISFPVLKELSSPDPETIRSAAKDENGYNRYSTTKLARHESSYYLVCTQWTDRHRGAFLRWLRSFES